MGLPAPAIWTLKVAAPPLLERLMGVPNGFPRNAVDARVVAELIDSIFPVRPRAQGAIFDGKVHAEIAAFLATPADVDRDLGDEANCAPGTGQTPTR